MSTKLFGEKTLIDRIPTLDIIYIGTAPSGTGEDEPLWRIQKLHLGPSGNAEKILWAKSDVSGNCKWSDRYDLEYK